MYNILCIVLLVFHVLCVFFMLYVMHYITQYLCYKHVIYLLSDVLRTYYILFSFFIPSHKCPGISYTLHNTHTLSVWGQEIYNFGIFTFYTQVVCN